MQNAIQNHLDEFNNLDETLWKSVRTLFDLPPTDTRRAYAFIEMAKAELLIDGLVNQKWLPDVMAWLKLNCWCEHDKPYQVAFYTVEGKRVNVTLMGYFWNPILRRKQWTKSQLPAWLSNASITSAKPLVRQVHKLIIRELESHNRKPYAARSKPHPLPTVSDRKFTPFHTIKFKSVPKRVPKPEKK